MHWRAKVVLVGKELVRDFRYQSSKVGSRWPPSLVSSVNLSGSGFLIDRLELTVALVGAGEAFKIGAEEGV